MSIARRSLRASPPLVSAPSAQGAASSETEGEALAAILERCTCQDERAFAELYTRTGAIMYATAIRIVRRRDWAEEVVQESYFNIWSHIADYRSSLGRPLTWMIAVVRNRALDWLRHPYAEFGAEDYYQLAEAIPDDAPGLEQQLEIKRSGCRLSRCLLQLPPNERHAIVLA